MPWTHDSKPFVFIKGPVIFSLESVFFHWQRYPRRRVAPQSPPLHETARPRELEQPYRKGHGHMFRFPLTRRGIVLGFWEPAGLGVPEDDESNYLMQAVEGAMIPGVTATEISSWSRGRGPKWFTFAFWQQLWKVHHNKLPSRFLDPLRYATTRDQETVAPPADEYDEDVIPYDGRVYDLEEARVNLGEQGHG